MQASYLVFLPLMLWTAQASIISFVGNLRTDANVVACGSGCVLDSSSTDGEYAQFAAVVDSFSVGTTSTMQAITFGYGGGVNGAGQTIAQGGLEPYLSLFLTVPGTLSRPRSSAQRALRAPTPIL